MNIANPSLPSLYKPAVYASLCSRADVTIFVALQNDINLSDGCMTFSPAISNFFGFKSDNTQCHIGIPDELWSKFSQINFQSFSVTTNYLSLHYHVDEEHVNSYRTAIGIEKEIHLSGKELIIRLPLRKKNSIEIQACVVLHLHHMSSTGEVIEGENQQISITKKHMEKLDYER
ncbi:hypothetical protein ACTFQF_00115 [Aliivibrio fischeri]|uniref:Uncharacterized protein n=1 Tax=Aliivibrio fischeri (strain MJ11) TaxID=388396 RepID=B5EW40_ALIFM|nr:hypothetical protein [Aliivibrio fischeri]ACH64749.1 hypothetical protein VFMJ11_B0097 [Aliivibrio fischeri MJ11]MUK37634.1 hypothetical protein [Aliivibrio fischeri]